MPSGNLCPECGAILYYYADCYYCPECEWQGTARRKRKENPVKRRKAVLWNERDEDDQKGPRHRYRR